MADDEDELTRPPPVLHGKRLAQLPADEERFRELRGALDNLVREIRAGVSQQRNNLGIKINVALNMGDRVLKKYPPPPDIDAS